MTDRRALLRSRIAEEFGNLDVRFSIVQAIIGLFPPLVGNRSRVRLLRFAGVRIGRGTTIGGPINIHGAGRPASRVTIGTDCWINMSSVFDASRPITIGNRVAMGHQVMLLTSTHDVGPPSERAGALRDAPIEIGDGVWLGARCTILPGVVVGAGAIVATGAVVTKSVEPNTIVAGVPARVVRTLDSAH